MVLDKDDGASNVISAASDFIPFSRTNSTNYKRSLEDVDEDQSESQSGSESDEPTPETNDHLSKKLRADNVPSLTPCWYQGNEQYSSNYTRKLHQEILHLSGYLAPTPEEHAIRQDVVERIRKVVLSLWPSAKLHPFGSFATKLYLPSGDIDLVILCQEVTSKHNVSALRKLANLLQKLHMVSNMQVIAKARVPIIKFADKLTSCTVDISFNMHNGIDLASWIREQVKEHPAIKPLVLFLKLFLHQRGLNAVFTGGVGSFAILSLILSFLQHHPRIQRREIREEENLGVLLIEFFELYGRHFNMVRVGLSLLQKGSYYRKHAKGWHNHDRPHLLSIEDPLDPKLNDIAKNSFNISAVRQSFEHAYQVLTRKIVLLNATKRSSHANTVIGDGPCIIISSILEIGKDMISDRARMYKNTKKLPNSKRGNDKDEFEKFGLTSDPLDGKEMVSSIILSSDANGNNNNNKSNNDKNKPIYISDDSEGADDVFEVLDSDEEEFMANGQTQNSKFSSTHSHRREHSGGRQAGGSHKKRRHAGRR